MLCPSTSASPAVTASARSVTDTCAPTTKLAADSTSASASPSFSPAASNAVKVTAGSPGSRDANACSRCLVSGIDPFRTPRVSCWLAVTGSSTRASGFPAACSSTRWRTTGSQHPVRVQQRGRGRRVQRAEPQLRQPGPGQRVVLQFGFAGGAH